MDTKRFIVRYYNYRVEGIEEVEVLSSDEDMAAEMFSGDCWKRVMNVRAI